MTNIELESADISDGDMVDYDPVIPFLHGVQSIAWPFIISGGGSLFHTIDYLYPFYCSLVYFDSCWFLSPYKKEIILNAPIL